MATLHLPLSTPAGVSGRMLRCGLGSTYNAAPRREMSLVVLVVMVIIGLKLRV